MNCVWQISQHFTNQQWLCSIQFKASMRVYLRTRLVLSINILFVDDLHSVRHFSKCCNPTNEWKIDLNSHQTADILVVWRSILTDNCDILWYEFCGAVVAGEKAVNFTWETWEKSTDMEPLCWIYKYRKEGIAKESGRGMLFGKTGKIYISKIYMFTNQFMNSNALV